MWNSETLSDFSENYKVSETTKTKEKKLINSSLRKSDKLNFKMRWKWLLLLSLISISLVVVNGDDEAEKVDTVNDNYDDDTVYDEKSDDTKIDEEIQTDTDKPIDVDPSVETEVAVEQTEEEQPKDEDTVDVENVPIGKQKGKYMNYDDYFVGNALDGSDSNYNWNGE